MNSERGDQVWEIALGKKVGPFVLGATIADVLRVLKNRTPCRAMEIVYCEDAPFEKDIEIDSPEDGLKLLFNPITQLLTKIEFYKVNLVALRYHSELIFGKRLAPTFISIYQVFGPTYPGKYDALTGIYKLQYPGACFQFPVPLKHKDLYQRDKLPMELPDGSTPAAIAMTIFAGNNVLEPEPPMPLKQFYFEEVAIQTYKDKLLACTFTKSDRTLTLGATPQEVVSEIGPPHSTYYKSVVDNAKATGEYFHNYPDLGIDVFYTECHELSKIIFRTNIPGNAEFNTYLKCNFRLLPLAEHFPIITPETKWSDIRAAMGKDVVFRPMVHDSASVSDPFPASYFYTLVPGCIFEVLQNDAIASLTVTQSLKQI